MNLPTPKVTNRDALLALLKSGRPYVTECEVTTTAVTTYYYEAGSTDAIASVVIEGHGIGAFTNLGTRIMLGDTSAEAELQSAGGPEQLLNAQH